MSKSFAGMGGAKNKKETGVAGVTTNRPPLTGFILATTLLLHKLKESLTIRASGGGLRAFNMEQTRNPAVHCTRLVRLQA